MTWPVTAIGRLLRPLRADPSRSPLAGSGFDAPATITITSPDFAEGTAMPAGSAGRGVGDDISPALRWTGVPESAGQLVLVLDDIDVPLPRPLIHSVAILPAGSTGLGEGEFTSEYARIIPTMLGKNGYSGPRPILGHRAHRYRFTLLALDRAVSDETASLKALLAAAHGHVLARGTLTGTYER